MSKYNPKDGIEEGTLVVSLGSNYVVTGTFGTLYHDDGTEMPLFRWSDGSKCYCYLDKVSTRSINEATPQEWDEASKFTYGGTTTALLKDSLEDVIDSPAHYNNGGIECIDYIRQQLGEEGYIAYCEGNMIKYQHRYKYKAGIEDLEKSCKYQEWLVEALKDKQERSMAIMTQRNL
jgi:hypothetical protein